MAQLRIARTGLRDDGFQALHEAGRRQFGAALGQEAGRARLLRAHLRQALLHLRRLLQLHALAQFALLQVGDALVGFASAPSTRDG